MSSVRNLAIVLGDQLDPDSNLFDGFEPERDRIWMAEVIEEATKVPSHRARIALFFAAMRHFRRKREQKGWTVEYSPIEATEADSSLSARLATDLARLQPDRVRFIHPGEWDVEQSLTSVLEQQNVPYEMLPDTHFLCGREEFEQYAAGRDRLVMEYFYRTMRKKHGVLITEQGEPVGGEWNYDDQNRESFSADGPGDIPPPRSFPPDELTSKVLQLVRDTFPDHPGGLETFDWPVTPRQAGQALDDFIRNRLPNFGDFQDAMWGGDSPGHPYLYHSRLSSSLNLKLLDPRDVVDAAVQAYERDEAPLNAVEGFVRQILGWREFVRGVYWMEMPKYRSLNRLEADRSLPSFYWTGDTSMACMKQTIRQTMEVGYAHHIQRLMVTGLFAMLYGVDPRQVHEWYLAVYVDAVEWVELPNTLGMSQYADGGILGTKPYAASGRYIHRMSNYCKPCPYNPSKSVGDDACPFTTLYWDFLSRHESTLNQNPRMNLQLANLDRKSDSELEEIRLRADQLRRNLSDP